MPAYPVAENSGPWRAPDGLHRKSSNVLFADGHVQMVKREHLLGSGVSARETEGAIWKFY